MARALEAGPVPWWPRRVRAPAPTGIDGVEVSRPGSSLLGTRSAAGPPPEAPGAAHAKGKAVLAHLRSGAPDAREIFLAEFGALIRFAIHTVLRQRGLHLDQDRLEEIYQAQLLSFFDQNCRRLRLYEGREGASFATYLRVCATRGTLDHLRRENRRTRWIEPEGEATLSTLPDQRSGPERQSATHQRIEQVRAFIAQLPIREQILVRMHFVEGRSIPEVARSLRMTDNATHVMKSRLRSKLRQELGGLDGDE